MKIFLLFAVALGIPAVAQPVVNVPPGGAKVNLTIAQDDNILVSDRRAVALPAGRSIVRFSGVAPRLESEGANVQPVFSGPSPVELLEQHFVRDKPASGAALSFFEGKTVTVMRDDGKQFTGVLKKVGDGWLVETADGLVLNYGGTVLLPRLADDKVAPALEWLVNSPAAGAYRVEARYPLKGLSWNTSYHATLSPNGDRIALRAWLEVTNRSGVNFGDAQLALQIGKLDGSNMVLSYPRPVTLPSGEARQLSYAAVDVAVNTELVADFSSGNFLETSREASPTLSMHLKNDAASGLGLPLPEGQLTTWQQAPDGGLRFLNDQKLAFLPVGEEVLLALAQIKEITVQRTLIASRKLNPRVAEHTVGFVVTNKRSQPVTLLLRDKLPDNAKITDSTQEPEALGTNTVRFKLTVPANGKAEFKYTTQTGN